MDCIAAQHSWTCLRSFIRGLIHGYTTAAVPKTRISDGGFLLEERRPEVVFTPKISASSIA